MPPKAALTVGHVWGRKGGARERIVRVQAVILIASGLPYLSLDEGSVDIAAWLRELGLERYEAVFRDN
jgi:hypothetical protein